MKLLVIQPTFVPVIDGSDYLAPNDMVDVDTHTGHALVTAGKALYADKRDDRSKVKTRTASPEQIKAAADAAKAAKAAAKADTSAQA